MFGRGVPLGFKQTTPPEGITKKEREPKASEQAKAKVTVWTLTGRSPST